MIFEVVNRDNISVMRTEQVSCIPSAQELSQIQSGGYRFRLDGKIATVKKIKELLKNDKDVKK